MQITQVEIFDIDLSSATYHWNPVLIRIQTDEGISGVGEVGLAYGTGSSAGVGMVRDLARDILIGADPLRIDHIWDRMFRRTFWGQGGGPVVYGGMSAIDIALWDLKGKVHGLPVYEMLGGRCHDRLLVYANGWYRSANTPDEYAERAASVVADGYKAMKFDPFAVRPDGIWDYPSRALSKERADLAVARVAAVRKAVGPDIEILVEVHGNLGTTSAIQVGKRLEELRPFFYEEPVDALNVESMRKVSENVAIPIAAGERLYTRYGFRPYIESQVLDILQPDMCLAGGISEVKKIAAHAETYNLHIQPHNCASPISTAAAVQLDACIPNFIIQEIFPYRQDANYDLVQQALELQVVDGYLSVPELPGIGMELNDDALVKHRKIVVA
jgi:galactonate dehydratase